MNSPESTGSIAVIGAGVAGLTAAIRLAEQGERVELFEAAPKPGGRTRSFIDPSTGELCDNGPHLLIGAYQATNKLLEQCGAAHQIAWQNTLELPMWDKQRGFFTFKPATWMPFQLALLLEVSQLPGHHRSSSTAMLRLAVSLKSAMPASLTVQDWMQQLAMPDLLIQDLIEPLCLGAMNEPIETASACSFRRVLHDSFGSREKSRLGWFKKPLDEALIQPLTEQAQKLDITLHLRHRVRSIQGVDTRVRVNDTLFQKAIIALPAYASQRLLGRRSCCATSPITNIHLWFDRDVELPCLFVGGIGTTGHWFFDISAQMNSQNQLRHLCVVISADDGKRDDLNLIRIIMAEIRAICANTELTPVHYRIIREKRATVLVRNRTDDLTVPASIIDASESPQVGDLPATIELAVLRGEKAALLALDSLH